VIDLVFERADPVFASWESALKIPSGSTSRQWLPELTSAILEIPIDMVSEPMGAKIGKALGGLLLSTVPQFVAPIVAPWWAPRDTEDMHAIAKHWLAQVLDPTPADLVRIASAISELRAGITFGDWTRIARAFGVKTPEQITAEMKTVVDAFSRALGFGAAPPPAPPMAVAPAPPTAAVFPPAAPIEVPGFG